MIGVLVIIGIVSASIVLLTELYNEIRNVYCQAKHTLKPQSWYYVPPFNISKGWQEYAIVCEECDRIIRYITQIEYVKLSKQKSREISASVLATIIVAVLDWVWRKWNANDITEIIDNTDVDFNDLELRGMHDRNGDCRTKTGTESGNSKTCECCMLCNDNGRETENRKN